MRPLVLSLAVALSLLASAAAADVPPPPGYVEQCTPARQQLPGTECVGCASYFGSVNKCPELLGGAGFTKACQSSGASVWTEVWCRPVGGEPLPEAVSKEVTRPTEADLLAARLLRGGWVSLPAIGIVGIAYTVLRRRRAARQKEAVRTTRTALL